MRENGPSRRFRKMIGSWSPAELQRFIGYEEEDLGKKAIYVGPKYTSQKCSRRGHPDKDNGHGSIFKCKNCGFELNVDLNALRNIEALGKSGHFRLLSASQSLRFGEPPLMGGGETSNGLLCFSWGQLTRLSHGERNSNGVIFCPSKERRRPSAARRYP